MKRDLVFQRLLATHGVVNCYCCGLPVSPQEATLEHIIPRSRGGSGNRRNLAISHPACNVRKGSKVTARDLELGSFRKSRATAVKTPPAMPQSTSAPLPVAAAPERLDLFLTGDWDVCRYVSSHISYSKVV